MERPVPEWSYQLTQNLIRPASSVGSLSAKTDASVSRPSSAVSGLAPNVAASLHQPKSKDPDSRPSSHTSTAPLVSSLPANAIQFHPVTQADADSSFGRYIDRSFQPSHANILKDRLPTISTPSPSVDKTGKGVANAEPMSHFWANLASHLSEQSLDPPHKSEAFHLHDDRSGNGREEDEKTPWWMMRDDQDGFYTIGALLFLFGFICPPLWWLGSFWPRKIQQRGGKMAERWQKLNRVMSIGFSVIVIIAIIVVGIIYATTKS
ncbi:uncharacterized protein BYT42DRAFT_561400 [Radiomyces spectabilis]|uniref:uncharacterized protein n=1 Tax=Radiomyces spectabilis TaxID=64574 RepID=UPI00221ED7E8|nr:uncharacterized protein BYT42DRAFT_561400 [Radiomyces spectabilis]KAI8388835.1 hypothetical protein BYT42DRAFT_561400 [Radiomyces spectabilis]